MWHQPTHALGLSHQILHLSFHPSPLSSCPCPPFSFSPRTLGSFLFLYSHFYNTIFIKQVHKVHSYKVMHALELWILPTHFVLPFSYLLLTFLESLITVTPYRIISVLLLQVINIDRSCVFGINFVYIFLWQNRRRRGHVPERSLSRIILLPHHKQILREQTAHQKF